MKAKPERDSSLETFSGQVQVCVTGLYMGGCAGHDLENTKKLFRDTNKEVDVNEMITQFGSSMTVTTEHQLNEERFQKMRMVEVEETVVELLKEFYKLDDKADISALRLWRTVKGA